VSERDGLGIWHVMNISYVKCGGRSDLIQFSSTASFKKKKGKKKNKPTTTPKNAPPRILPLGKSLLFMYQ